MLYHLGNANASITMTRPSEISFRKAHPLKSFVEKGLVSLKAVLPVALTDPSLLGGRGLQSRSLKKLRVKPEIKVGGRERGPPRVLGKNHGLEYTTG